jgi:hypothetical protein
MLTGTKMKVPNPQGSQTSVLVKQTREPPLRVKDRHASVQEHRTDRVRRGGKGKPCWKRRR